MKRFIIQYKLIVVLLLFAGFSSMGQAFEKSRNLSRTFKLGQGTEIQVSNKYGNIQLIIWEKDSVKFDIKMKVVTNKESKLNSTFDYIDFDFTNSEYYVIAQTSFAGQGTFWSDVKDLANTVFSGGTKTQIDYKIYLPSTASIKLDNKYGNIFISDHNGPININLSNGDLKSHSLNGETTIKLQFANANVNYIKNGNLDISYYSEIHVNEVDKLSIRSRSSRVSIDKSDLLDINSSRDKYYLERVNSLTANNSFSYLEIKNLGNQIKFDANYGELVIKSIDNAASKISMNVESTDIIINKSEQQTFKLELIYNERAGIYFFEDLKNKVTTKEDEEKELVKSIGILGNTDAKPIEVNAYILSGNIRINNK